MKSEASFLPGVQRDSASHFAGSSCQPQLQDWITVEASVWVVDGLFCKQSCPGANNTAEEIDVWCCLVWEEQNFLEMRLGGRVGGWEHLLVLVTMWGSTASSSSHRHH